MNPDILSFTQLYFTDELVREINRSFNLLEDFQLNNINSVYIDIIMQHQTVHNEQMTDEFINQLNRHLDYVLSEHTITLIDDVSIYEKNEILNALLLVQSLEDYTGILAALESISPDEEQLADIISDLSQLPKVEVLRLIEYFNPKILNELKHFIEQKTEESIEEPNIEVFKAYKLFNKCFGNNHIGYELVENGSILNKPFELYLSFIKEAFISTNIKYIALNLYSVLIISSDGSNQPNAVYRDYSQSLFQDLNQIKAIESELTQLVSIYNQRKAIEKEASQI